MEENDILYHKQFGFRKGNSTINALMQITEKIKESIDKGKYGCGIFIDLRKAFDTVNHNILLMKLEHYGIRESAQHWFAAYLNKRKQFVSINGENSELRELSCGVPQASVLGPLLFLININDLPNISNKLDIFLFADDTNIYYENESFKELEKIVNKELKNLYLWLSINRLALNIEKTTFLIFHPFNKPLKYNVTLKIHKKAILEEQKIKYLGIIIDSTLSWKAHLSNLSKKLSRTIGVMYKLRPFVNLQIMKNIYHSLFYSHLIYGIQVWGNACDTHLKAIQMLQNRVVRLITYNDNFPIIPGPLPASNPLFCKLQLLKIKELFTFMACIFIYKCLNTYFLPLFEDWFTFSSSIHEYRTRLNFNINSRVSTNNLFIPIARTSNYGMKLLKVSGPKIWNSIPLDIRSSTSFTRFKKLVKNHLINKYNL